MASIRESIEKLESLRNDVGAAYDRLTDQWEDVAKTLELLPIPAAVAVDVLGGQKLCWMKFNGRRRLCLVHDGTTRAFEEWSAMERLAMLDHVPELFAAASGVVREFIADVDEACKRIDKELRHE